MTLEDFFTAALEPKAATRAGQNFINLLNHVKPALAYRLKRVELDPYYVDRLLPAAIQYTVDNWHLYPLGHEDDFIGVDE